LPRDLERQYARRVIDSPAPDRPFTVLSTYGDEYVAYAWKNVDVIVWSGSGSGPGVRSCKLLLQQRLHEVGKVSVVHVALPLAGMPDAEGRKEFNAMAERFSKMVGCIVSVIEREGFVGSALRGLTTSIYALTSRHTAHCVVRTVAEAAAWLPAPHLRGTGVELDPTELGSVFAAIRALHP
jgi:hypothetical protein